ncbi:hypothetical protein [Actibacterium lipolyticum]|nr:hypothetical protein [Actibacterium lipolyticum]
MKHYATLTMCAASLALAGCGGGSSSPTAAPPTGVTPASYATVDAAAVAMQDTYTDANGDVLAGVTVASETEVMNAANATYSGYVGGDLTSGGRLVGELSIAADFASETATSTATNFFHDTDGAYAGTLSGAGIIVPGAPGAVPQLSTTIAGDLTNGGSTHATSIGLEGDFIASGGDVVAVAGLADGTVGAGVLFTGTFAAEK